MVVSAHKEEKSDLETSGTDPRMQLFRRTLRASINFGCHGIGQASGLREAFFQSFKSWPPAPRGKAFCWRWLLRLTLLQRLKVDARRLRANAPEVWLLLPWCYQDWCWSLMLKKKMGMQFLSTVDRSWRLNPGCHGIGQASGLAWPPAPLGVKHSAFGEFNIEQRALH